MSRLPALESSMTVKPQALRLPFFPASTSLIDPPNYDGGIPIRALEDGLRCIISPWETMDIGDEVQLYWQNLTSPVATKTIQLDDEVDKPVVLRVAKSQVLDGDALPVFYRVIRRNQAPEDSDPKLTYLVKTTRPGGYDDNPEPGHSGFQYTFLTDISNGIDAGMADLGVKLRIEPYEHMTAFDRIVCRWGSQEVVHYPVTQAQVDDPVNNPIVITFTREVIERAGDGSRVVVTYQVIDCVGNYPDERDSWAPFSYVLVDLGGNRLDAPLVLMGGRPTNNIDLEQLGNDDVEVRVYTNTTDFKVGDSLRLTWTGTPAQGSPIVVGPLVELVDAVPFHYDFIIPNAAVKAIAQGWATVSYVRVRDGEPDRPSKNASVNVKGDISRLPAPSVAQAPGGTLPSNSPYATISVPYFEGRRTGDLITIHCQGRRPGGGETYYSIPIIVSESDATNSITRDLPGSQIAPLDGGTLKLYYVVANDDLTVRSERESLPLELNVGVAAPDFNAPQITEAEGDVLLPENTPNGANVIAPFNVPSDTRAGDIVGLRWVGSVTGAHPLYEIPLSSQTAGKPVPFLVRAEHIHPNLNGTVTVDYYRKRGAEMTRFSRERVWRVGGVELDLQPPSIRQASGNSLNPVAAKDLLTAVIPQGELLPDDLMSVTWTAAPGTSPEGSYTTPTRPISETGLEIALPNSVLAYNLGKTVTVTYSVTRGSTPAKTSAPLTLNVLNIPAQSPELPTPTIDAASNGELDVTTLTGNEPLYVTQWMFQRPRQRVWLRYDGTDTNGNATEEVVWEGAPHNSDQGLVIWAAYGWLQTLKDGSVVEITFMVNFDGVANEATAVRFPVRTYTVRAVALVNPTITSVRDSKGELANPGTTADTRVTLSGEASGGMTLQLYNGTTAIGPVITVAANGDWNTTLTGLSINTSYSIKARALYGAQPESDVRTFNVVAVLTPSILLIRDSKGELANPGTTFDTTVTLSGKASGGMTVQLYNGATAIGPVITVAANGDWNTTLTGLSATTYSIKARALYGTQPESSVRVFTVAERLVIDTTLMLLNGLKLIPDGNYGLEAREVFGNTATRVPTKGNPPYTYRSEVPAVASVSTAGKVSGLKNGRTNITVIDAKNQTATYSVEVRNVYRLLLNNSYLTPAAAVNWLRSVGAQMIDNGGEPLGWDIKKQNFTSLMPIYGGAGRQYGRYNSLNLTYPDSFIIETSMLDASIEEARLVSLTSRETRRSYAYIPT